LQVSIIVPVGGAGVDCERCLASLDSLDPRPAELIVVIDGVGSSFAQQAEVIGATVVELAEPRGPSGARNRGARVARGDLLFFVDSDVELRPDTVARVVEVFESEPELTAVIGSYDDAPAHPGFLSQYRNLLHHHVHQHGHREASTFWGACGVIRREIFEDLGGFNESFSVPSVEDIELGSRLRRAGHRIALIKDLQVKHLNRWGVANTISTDLLRRAAPWTELMLRDGRLLNDLNVRTADRMSVVSAFLAPLCLIAAAFWSPALIGAMASVVLMLVLNADLYGFFARRRGFTFALGSFVLHWIYLLVCGLGFMIGTLRYMIGPEFDSSSTASPRSSQEARRGEGSARGAFRLFIGESLVVPTGLLTVAYLTRHLGPAGYGLFTLAATIVLWIEHAITSFCSRPTVRFVGTVEDPATVAATASRIRLVIDVAAMVLVWLVAPAVSDLLGEVEMTGILRLFALDIPLFGRARVQRDVLVGLGRYSRAALATSGRWIFRLFLIVILVEAGFSIEGAVIGSICASIIEALLNRTGFGGLLIGKAGFPVLRMFGYAIPLFLSSVLMLLFNRMDLFLVKILGATTADVGAYAASQNAALVVGIIGSALSPVVLSTVSRQRAAGDLEAARGSVRNGLRAVLLYMPVAVLVSTSAEEIVPFLFGHGFGAGIPVLAILSIAAVALVFHGVGCATLTAAGEPRLVLLLTVPVPVIALAGHLAAIPRYGMTGAAAVSLVVTVLGASFVLIGVVRVWRTWSGWLTVIRVGFASLAVGLASASWSAPSFWIVVKLPVLAGLAFVLFLALGELRPAEIRATFRDL
jgi:O-antigen/teichoic acid export membrane protein/GT2 family glycosyltransferase